MKSCKRISVRITNLLLSTDLSDISFLVSTSDETFFRIWPIITSTISFLTTVNRFLARPVELSYVRTYSYNKKYKYSNRVTVTTRITTNLMTEKTKQKLTKLKQHASSSRNEKMKLLYFFLFFSSWIWIWHSYRKSWSVHTGGFLYRVPLVY